MTDTKPFTGGYPSEEDRQEFERMWLKTFGDYIHECRDGRNYGRHSTYINGMWHGFLLTNGLRVTGLSEEYGGPSE